jgi:putative ABC transport system ATP-binding protein
MLRIENARKRYTVGTRDVWALDGVSLEIERGDFVALKGPSGSGKSTLLNVLGLLDTLTEGSYHLEGELMVGKDPRERSRWRARQLGFIFQGYNLIPELSVFENVEVPLLIAGGKRRDYRERVEQLIADVGLADRSHHRPGELSGGQQQRVSIARALVKQPPLVIADEPTANLDSRTGREIMDLMAGLNTKYGTTFVFATHDENLLPYMHRVYHLLDGRIATGGEA